MRIGKILLCGLLMALPVLAEEAEDRQTATSLHYVTHELDTRQNKLSAGSNKALTYTNTAGNIEQRTVKENLTGGTTDTSLPQVNAVNAGLNTKQNDITTIDDHTAVTYTGQTGTIGQKGIYQTDGTYAEQSNNLIDAKTFNAALKNGLDSEFICTEYKPGTDLCWLWQIHNAGEPINLFDMSLIPVGETSNYATIVRNADGSITVTTSSIDSSVSTGKTLSQLAPGLQVGKTYKFSMNTTGTGKSLYLGQPAAIGWRYNTTQTVTQNMLNANVYVYASGVSTTATIYDIQIIEQNPDRPYTTLVPDGYTPVEYIEGTGTQWIDTGVSPTANFDFYLDAMLTANGIHRSIFGTSTGSIQAYTYNEDATMLVSIISGNATNGGIATGVVNNRFYIGLSPHGFLNYSGYRRTLERPYTPSGTLWLLLEGGYSSPARARIYGVKLYDGTTLTFQGIPARRDSDGAIGLYNTVGHNFLTNAATSGSDFTAGPEINNIVYLPQGQ